MGNMGCITLSATVASRATAMERKAIGIISCVHKDKNHSIIRMR